jgi:hypothetical protein
MKKFNTLRLDLAEKTLTPAEKKKREEIAMAMERENPGMPMGKKMAIATATAKRVAEENLDELKTDTLDSYITKVATGPSRGNTQTGIPKSIKAIGGVTTAIRKRAENDNPPFEPDAPKKNPSALAGKYGIGPSIAAHLAKKGMKAVLNDVNEEVKITHENPLVVVKDAEGHIDTHADLKTASEIRGITVSHHAVHTYRAVEVTGRNGKQYTVELSKHHASEVAKDNAPAVKEEADKEEADTPKKFTHVLIHSKTGNVVGKYTSLKAASRAGDRKDNAYGGYAHHVKYIGEAKEKTEYDYEGDMARGQLQSIIMNAQRVHDMLKDNDNLPEWVQSKITLAEDYISTVSNYMASEIDEETSPHTFEPATHKPTVKTSNGHSFEGNTYNAKGLKGASIYKHKDTGKYYANKIDANTTFHSSAKDAADKYHTKAK